MSHEASTHRRPLGVWILTVCDGLFAGIGPIAILTVLLAEGTWQQEFGMGIVEVAVAAAFSAAIVVASVGTWTGNNRARVALVVLVTVYYSFLILKSIGLLAADVFEGPGERKAQATIVRSAFWITVNFWYFLRRRTKEFYRPASTDSTQ